jgi:sulfite reductase beta subunit-like hemoprotein
MQRKLTFEHRSEDEEIKDGGLSLDFDEIARRGAMSKEEKSIAKWFGIYASRHPGNHMSRIVLPAGEITSAQARVVAKVSELYAQGRLSVTTRQALQLHWLKTPSLPDMMRDLAAESLSCFHGCGDVTRNVVCCPWAETCEFRRFNVRTVAKETAQFLTDARDLDNLPRKFKVTFSGCPAGCAQPFINCIGAIAVQRKGADGKDEFGFRLVIGGGMGWKAFVAQELYSFVPRKKIARVSRGIAILFRDHGNRRDRTLSRLKFVVNRYGIDKCREIVNEALEADGVDTSDLETESFEETGVSFPDRPLAVKDPVGTDGLGLVTIIVPKGELSHLQFKRLAEISEIFGNKRLYTTQRQNIEIHGVRPDKVAECKAAIEEAGFDTEGAEGLRDIVPCVGTTYCPKAVSSTRDMHDLLMDLVKLPKYDAIWDRVTVNITGCPNSCSPYRITDIGLRGMRIREDLGSVEGYEIRVGGTQEVFGRIVGEFKRDDCPVVVEKLLDTYMEVREGNETLAQCIQRIGWEA